MKQPAILHTVLEGGSGWAAQQAVWETLTLMVLLPGDARFPILRTVNFLFAWLHLACTSTACSVCSEEADTHSFGPGVFTELYKPCWLPIWSYTDGKQEAAQGCAQATTAAMMRPGHC